MAERYYVAVDLGAESGRVIVGNTGMIDEVYRFPNNPVRVRDSLYWDILSIFTNIKLGLKEAFRAYGTSIHSIGIDTWGVDFGLLDKSGDLLGNLYHYRDKRTDGVPEELFAAVPREQVFAETGIQFMQLNTIFQLYSVAKTQPEVLRAADVFLTTPDLLNYWLTGTAKNEYTIATTTQLYNPRKQTWAYSLMEKLGIPRDIFQQIVMPGTSLGPLLGHIGSEINAGDHVNVVAPACHDTGSAVAAVPAIDHADYAYISSGTWSLLGLETEHPIINEKSLACNFTNEGSAGGGFRFLKNIVGLWIVQECRRQWESDGKKYTYDELTSLAEDSGPARFRMDPNDPRFLKPNLLEDSMPLRIRRYCEQTGQPIPRAPGEVVRGILESLAACYAENLKMAMDVTGRDVSEIFIIGGGSRNTLLCRLTADATGKPVYSGPAEATALGNILLQAIACGDIESIATGRRIVREAFQVRRFDPQT